MYEKKQKDLKQEEIRKKHQEDKESKEVCTFKPKINTKRDYQTVQTRYMSPSIIKNDILEDKEVSSQRMKWVKDQILQHRALESAQYTFKPNLKASSSSRALSSARGASRRSNGEELPNGFDKVVNRMKKHQKEKEKLELRQYKSSIGERYDKEKLNKVKPPKFLTGSQEQGQMKGKELILCIEVAISPTQ